MCFSPIEKRRSIRFIVLDHLVNMDTQNKGGVRTLAVLLFGTKWLKYNAGLTTAGLLKLSGPLSTSKILRSGLAFARRPAATHAAVPPPAKMISTSLIWSAGVGVAITEDKLRRRMRMEDGRWKGMLRSHFRSDWLSSYTGKMSVRKGKVECKEDAWFLRDDPTLCTRFQMLFTWTRTLLAPHPIEKNQVKNSTMIQLVQRCQIPPRTTGISSRILEMAVIRSIVVISKNINWLATILSIC